MTRESAHSLVYLRTKEQDEEEEGGGFKVVVEGECRRRGSLKLWALIGTETLFQFKYSPKLSLPPDCKPAHTQTPQNDAQLSSFLIPIHALVNRYP